MSKIKLDAERARAFFHYDPMTGSLTWKVSKGRARPGTTVSTLDKDGYLTVGVNGVTVKAHRLIWLIVSGKWPDDLVDHRNGVRSDNRIDNLREATRLTNIQNEQKAREHSTTGLLGVSLCKGKPQAHIRVDGVKRYLGQFETPELAHEAYLAAKRQFHAGCTI